MNPAPFIHDETKLILRRNFDADIDTLFRALTEPGQIRRWFGPQAIKVQHAECDLRVGGRWAVGMIAPDGEEHHVSGEYLEIDAPRKVVFTFAWRSTPDRVSRVTYALAPDGAGRTTLTLTHERFADAQARDRHAEGWTGSLENLVAWLAAKGDPS